MVFDLFKLRSASHPSTEAEYYNKTLRRRLDELSNPDAMSATNSLSSRSQGRKRSRSPSGMSAGGASRTPSGGSVRGSGSATPSEGRGAQYSAAAYNHYYANRSRFPADQLRPYIKALLTAMLNGVQWDSDRARMGALSKEICERIKQRMIEIEGRGFKFIVNTTFSENLGQAGRADMSCHWEDTDAAVQEMFSNDTLIVVCLAYAVRV